MKTLTVKPSDVEIEEFDTLDEALAFALQDAPSGCVVSVHGEACALSANEAPDDAECSCEPFEIVAGAKA